MPVEDQLNDVDRELRDLLAIEPSPAFAVRVRERTRAQRMGGGSWGALRLLATMVVIAAIATGAILLPPEPAGDGDSVAHRAPTPIPAAPPRPEVRLDRAPAPRLLPVRVPAARAPRRTPGVSGPEVVVDGRQAEAIDRLLALARAGAVIEAGPPVSPPLAPIVVEPLSVPLINIEPPGGSLPVGRSAS